MSDLLVRLPSMGAYSADDLRAGFGKVTEQLDDLMCDHLASSACILAGRSVTALEGCHCHILCTVRNVYT